MDVVVMVIGLVMLARFNCCLWLLFDLIAYQAVRAGN